MTSNFRPSHPQQLYTPRCHSEARTPIVDNKYNDPKTGEVLVASGHEEYSGPPAVDIVISSLHAHTFGRVFRIALPFPMEKILCNAVEVIGELKLKIDSLVATTYAVRVVLAHDLGRKEFDRIAMGMANGVCNQLETTEAGSTDLA